jgi:regulatory protein
MEYEKALLKLQHYCAYQDRCHQEVRTKLLDIKVYGDELESIMTDLIRDDFLNEERYARSYCRGKFRMKKWGKNKILQGLKLKRISAYCIKKGMAEIEEDEYIETLQSIIEKNIEKHKSLGLMLAKDRAYKYAMSRGYEGNIILENLKNLS